MMNRTLIAQILGNDLESLNNYLSELSKRSAVLDFLSLYTLAKADGVVQRVKHIIHAPAFTLNESKSWDMYITRLLGRCIRHYFSECYVEKVRNAFAYRVQLQHNYRPIKLARNMVSFSYPWRIWGDIQTKYQHEPILYWSTRGLAPPSEVRSALSRYNQFVTNTTRYDRCRSAWDAELSIEYGSAAGYYAYRGIRCGMPGTYYATQAYQHMKGWLAAANALIADEQFIRTIGALAEHDTRDDKEIEERLEKQQAREKQAQLENETIDLPIYEPEVEEEENTENLTVQEALFRELRRRGLME